MYIKTTPSAPIIGYENLTIFSKPNKLKINMHKQAIIVDKTLLLILFFKFSFKEKKVERSVVIMQIKIIIEEA